MLRKERVRVPAGTFNAIVLQPIIKTSGIFSEGCLLYTSDAADERSSVDLGGRRILKKKTRSCMHAN